MQHIKKTIIFISLVLIAGIIFSFNAVNFARGEDINEEVKQLNMDIQSKKNEIKKIQERQKAYTRALKQKQSEKASLNSQLAILDNRLAKAELDIERVETEILVTNLEIKKINTEIADINDEISTEKEHLTSVLRLMHRQDQFDPLKIILLNNNLSDFLNQVKYLKNINSEIGESIDSLGEYKEKQEEKLASLAKKNKEQVELKKELKDKKITLEGEQNVKAFILDQTRSSEKEYQRLIKLAKQEQEQAAQDIVNIERLIRAKIAEMSDKKLEFNDAGVIWPVPKNKITTYFHDPEYPFRYIFEHPAVDIRAAQGTAVKAAASGYVARAKDGGKGYSYIMIVHGDGLATVYGHVSKIYVQDDEYVVQGQTIGATGGLPGTPGAGRLTTGPHLHFEVRLNGIPVNPLEYLP